MSGLKLYEMAFEYQRVLDLCDQAGDPESERAFLDTLEGLKGQIEAKLDNCAAVVRTMEAEMKALQEEEERLYARRRAIDSNRERLKGYMEEQMKACGLEKSKGARFSVQIQTSQPHVEIDELTKLPDFYFVTKREPDKRAILADLTAGKAVPGAHAERSTSLRIR
jgi:phage host-nuclease inhibitor protein Gam